MAQIELHSREGQNKTTQSLKKNPYSTQDHFETTHQQQIRQDDKPTNSKP